MAKLYSKIGSYSAPEEKRKKLYSNIGGNANDINGATYLGGKVLSGAASIGIGAYNLIAGTFDQLTGNTYAAEKRYAENDPQALSKKLDSQYNANGFMSFMGSVAEGVGQSIPTAVISLIPVVGTGVAAATSFAGHAGMSVGEAYQKSGNLGAREYLYGAAMGGMESALEIVGGKVGGWIGGSKLGTSAANLTKGATKGIAKGAATAGKLGLATTAGRIVKGGATEFAEEFIEAYAEVGLQRALSIDPNASVTFGEALYAGAVGFASGGVMSGTTSLINNRAMASVGKRVMDAGEVDITISAAAEIASAFKSNGAREAEALKTLKDNLDLWERTENKTGTQAQMILGNIELSMNVVSAMADQQGTVARVTQSPEKFLPYAKLLFGDAVTLADLKDPDSRVVRFIAASNWATGEADALAIRAKKSSFADQISAVRENRGAMPSLGSVKYEGGDAAYLADDGEFVLVSKGKNDLYTVMKGADLDNLSAYELNGSTVLEQGEVLPVLANIWQDVASKRSQAKAAAATAAAGEPAKLSVDEAPENNAENGGESKGGTTEREIKETAVGAKNADESKGKTVLSESVRRERARIIDDYDAEVQDKARKLLGKDVDAMSADRRIAVFEAIASGENVSNDVMRAACYFISKRPGLYVYFDRDLNGLLSENEQSKSGFHRVMRAAKARLVVCARESKALRRTLVHEVFHDIATTAAGKRLIDAALESADAKSLMGTAKNYGKFFAKAYAEDGVKSFEDFFTDGKYDEGNKESVLAAIYAYEKQYEAVLGQRAITEEIAAIVASERLGQERFMKMAKKTGAAGLLLRGVRRMLTYLRTKKEARPLYLEAVQFENLFLDAVGQRAEYDGEGVRFAQDTESYSYDALTKKRALAVVALSAEIPQTADGKVDKKAILARGKLNARKQKNPNNTETDTYVRVDDIGLDVLLGTKGLQHGLVRSEETALAVMKIGDILKESVAVNELNGNAARKTDMSYVLLGACHDGVNLYVVRSVVSKLQNDVTEIDVYQLGAVKGKKTETPNSALKRGAAVTEQSSLISSESPIISIADFLQAVKEIPLINEIFSEDVAAKLGVARSKGSLSGDIRFELGEVGALSHDESELNPSKTSEGQKKKEIAKATRGKFYKKLEAKEIVEALFHSEAFKQSDLSMLQKEQRRIVDFLWRKLNEHTPGTKEFDEAAEIVADFMVRYTFVEEAMLEPMEEIQLEQSRIALSIMEGLKHKINVSDDIRAELCYRYGGRDGRKKGEGNRIADLWHQKDGRGMSVEMAVAHVEEQMRAEGFPVSLTADAAQDSFDAFVELYAHSMQDVSTHVKNKMAKVATADEMRTFRAEVKRKLELAAREKGKETKLRKMVRAYESTQERLREKLREVQKNYEGAVKIQYGAADAVFLAKEVGEMVTKRKYVNAAEMMTPEMETIGKLLASIATPRKIKSKEAREVMRLLAAWYTPQNIDGDSVLENGEASESSFYHPMIKEKMEKIGAGQENAQLTFEEVRDLAQVLAAVRKIIQNYGLVQLNGRKQQTAEVASGEVARLTEYVAAGKKEGGGLISKMFHNAGTAIGKKLKNNFLYRAMTPKQVIQSLEWYDKDGVLTRAYADLQGGMAGAGSDYADMMRPVVQFFDEHKKYEKRLSKEYITYNGEDMTVGQAISLYMTTKRDQALLGFEKSGFRFMGRDGKVRSMGARPAADIRSEIEAALSSEDKAYIKVVEGVFERAKELKIKTDTDIFAFTNVEEGYYYPISRDTMEIARRVSDLRQTMRELAVVSNKSFNKNTVKGAANALFIADVTMVTDAHAMGVAQYANLYMPMSTWDRIWNKRVDDGKGDKVSVRRLVNDEIWNGKNKRDMADLYFRQLFADMQGVKADKRAGDDFYSNMRSTYVSAALGFNLSSILKQTGSYTAALVYLSPTDLARGLGMNLKTDRLEMWKYSKVANARMFERGRFAATEANSRLEELGAGTKKLGQFLTQGVEGMDNMVVGRLWNACQACIERTKGLAVGSEENKVEAGKLLDTVINDTQSSSTQDTRSAFQRGNMVTQTVTMFTSDAVKQLSLLYEGAARIYSAHLRRKMGKGSDAEVKRANAFFGRAIAGFLASTALTVAITQLIKWLLGKEREEDETVAEDIAKDTLSQVLGIIPFVSDGYDLLFNRYDVNSFVFDTINTMADGVVALGTSIGKAVNGKVVTKQEFLKPARTIFYQLGNFTGIPFRNIVNYVMGVTKHISPEAGYSFDALFEAPSYTADVQKAIERGDYDLAQYILELSLKDRMKKGTYDSAIAAELLYFANTGEDVVPSKIPTSVNGSEVTAAEYKQMKKIYDRASDAISSMIASDAYGSLTDEEKADAIRRVYRTYLSLAKADVKGEKRSAAVWVAPLLGGGASCAALSAIAAMESTDEATRAEQVSAYLNALDLSNEEKYLLLFAAGYRNEKVMSSVRRSIEKSDFSPEQKKQFALDYPEKD